MDVTTGGVKHTSVCFKRFTYLSSSTQNNFCIASKLHKFKRTQHRPLPVLVREEYTLCSERNVDTLICAVSLILLTVVDRLRILSSLQSEMIGRHIWNRMCHVTSIALPHYRVKWKYVQFRENSHCCVYFLDDSRALSVCWLYIGIAEQCHSGAQILGLGVDPWKYEGGVSMF